MPDQVISACVKHVAANNQEGDRNDIDVNMSVRALREIYLPGFKAAVEQAVEALRRARPGAPGRREPPDGYCADMEGCVSQRSVPPVWVEPAGIVHGGLRM